MMNDERWCSVCKEALDNSQVGDDMYRSSYGWCKLDEFGPIEKCIFDGGLCRSMWIKQFHQDGSATRWQFQMHIEKWDNISLGRRQEGCSHYNNLE